MPVLEADALDIYFQRWYFNGLKAKQHKVKCICVSVRRSKNVVDFVLYSYLFVLDSCRCCAVGWTGSQG